MAEEQSTDHVDQMDATESYLTNYTLVADENPDGDKLEGDDKDVDLESKTTDTPDGEKTEEQKVADAAAAKEAITQKEAPPATLTVKSLTEPPKGFHSHWFSKGEDGKVAFDRDAAMGFLLPEGGKSRFEYSADRRKVVESDGTQEPPKDTYATFVEDEKKYRADVRKDMFQGLNSFEEAYNANGGNAAAAFQTATQALKELVATDFEERGIENEANWRKRQEELSGTDQITKETETQARSNESLLMNEIAGKFNMSPDEARGKYVELMRAGMPIINNLFDIANPEFLEGKTEAGIKNAFSNWWTKIASNQANLRFVYGLILNDVNVQLQPYLNRTNGLNLRGHQIEVEKPRNAPLVRGRGMPKNISVYEGLIGFKTRKG